jgi:hypothetical protein
MAEEEDGKDARPMSMDAPALLAAYADRATDMERRAEVTKINPISLMLLY